MKELALANNLQLLEYMRSHWSPTRRQTFYRFEASTKMRSAGFPMPYASLGTNLRNALAKYEREVLPLLEAWWERGAVSVETGPAYKTLEWALKQYETTIQFQGNALKTQMGNRHTISVCCRHVIQTGPWAGVRFGAIPIPEITPALVDQFYVEYLHTKTNRDGSTVNEKRSRQARNAMHILSTMLNAIKRKHENLFYKDVNPFLGLRTVHKPKGPRAANVAELTAFVRTADSMNLRSVSAIVLYAWELHARVSHFPYCAVVGDYRGRFREDEIFVRAEKVSDERYFFVVNDEGKVLFPALVERLDELKGQRSTGPLFVCENSHPDRPEAWVPKKLNKAIAMVCKNAKMDHLTLAQFRKGGLTESGSAGLTTTQIMSMSMHKTEEVLHVYTEKNQEVAMGAQEKRLAFRVKKSKRGKDVAVLSKSKNKRSLADLAVPKAGQSEGHG